ncbi:COMM domain-containing protein 5-like [Sitophilus oryzae]|uniref:COMM domain-containing protein 5 n=1 Tax=Sitophilus oryzae TaxID=7048 RepID=A0A6J2XAS5_SITOR|nr:COMM domain-containing protein 5-like [Sitophilus oryzae]
MSLSNIPKSTINLVTGLPEAYNSKVIKLALAALQPDTPDLSRSLSKLEADGHLSCEQLLEVLSLYIHLLKEFCNNKEKDFVDTLLEEGFPNNFVSNLPFLNNQTEIIRKYFSASYNTFENVSSIKWRIDISLLNNSIGCSSAPNITLCIKLTNGKLYILHLNKKEFHSLRFNIALILKEIKSRNLINKLLK